MPVSELHSLPGVVDDLLLLLFFVVFVVISTNKCDRHTKLIESSANLNAQSGTGSSPLTDSLLVMCG